MNKAARIFETPSRMPHGRPPNCRFVVADRAKTGRKQPFWSITHRIAKCHTLCAKETATYFTGSSMSNAQKSDQKEPATLILIGMTDPKPWLKGAFKNALVVEPDPARAKDLIASFEDDKRVEVIEAMLSEGGEDATLVVYNEPGLRGLRSPTSHLRKLFPGLRERARHTVRRLGIVEVIQKALHSGEGALDLWLDTGGEEAESLAALEAAGSLDRVISVTLRCGIAPLFEDSADTAALTGWLQDRGFVLDHRDDSDPDWPQLHFNRAPLFWELRESQTAYQALEARLAAREAELAAAQESLKSEKATLQKQLTEQINRVEQLETECKDLELLRPQVERLRTDLDKQRQHSTDLQNKLTERTERVRALNAEKQQVDSEKTKLASQITSLQAERDDALAKAEDLSKTLATKTSLVEELKTREEIARGDLALALRMQSIAQSDLRDLQARYHEADSDRRRQAELLQALTPRLQQAAAQLQMLTQSDPSAAAQLVDAGTEAPPVQPAPRKHAKTARKRKTNKSETASTSSRTRKPRSDT
ncbi:hypothetical protein PGB28_14195 [Primorskyibacter aestuariivivens]|uniref:hypothetical protein n=1 Tax=Primorskyibacter aestuariivivens TaxID=1888912 RepID=UPI0023006A15|nr:hypothetical protein [Primorskyibacter aestuariivivens]MDA7429617.1 hypothetical protein [Primorskyibacter aestuariivivens]